MANDEPTKLRVMVDANVLFAGTLWPRFPHEVLRHAVNGDYQLVLSPRIIEEAKTAIERVAPKSAHRFADILETLHYEEVPTPTDEDIANNSQLIRDAKDVHVALAAINGEVDYLISQDRDFTEPDEPIHQHLNILLPGTFLREHLGWTSESLENIRKRNWDDFTDEP